MTTNPYESPATDREIVDRSQWPLWVRLGLWGIPTRGLAWAFVVLSLAIAIGSIAYGFVDRRFFIGGIMSVAALHYYLATCWVDQNSRW
jgi:hypothetical protein